MYKTVRRFYDGAIYSVAAGMLGTEFRVEYKPGEWSYARPDLLEAGYALCVFEEKDQAVNFVRQENQTLWEFEVWECEVGQLFHNLPRKGVHRLKFPGDRILPKQTWAGEWPKGTVMTDMVKLTRRVA